MSSPWPSTPKYPGLCVFSLGYSLDRDGEVGGFVRVSANPIAPYVTPGSWHLGQRLGKAW